MILADTPGILQLLLFFVIWQNAIKCNRKNIDVSVLMFYYVAN